MSRWLPWLVGLLGFALVAGWFGLAGVAAVLGQVRPAGVAWYLAVTALVVLCYAARWRLVGAPLGAGLGLGRLVGARLAGDAVGVLVPSAKQVGEPVRVALLRRGGVPAPAATAAVTLDRLCELAGNSVAVMVYVLVFWLARARAPGSLGAGLAMALLLLALAALVVRLRLGHRPLAALYAGGWRRRFPGRFGWLDGVRDVEAHLTRFLRRYPRTAAAGLLAALLAEVLAVVQYHALLGAFGVRLDLPTLLLVLLGGGLARAVPTPGGLGALEATQVAVVGAAAGQPALGFAVAVILRLHDLLLVALGLAALLWQGVSMRRLWGGAANGAAA